MCSSSYQIPYVSGMPALSYLIYRTVVNISRFILYAPQSSLFSALVHVMRLKPVCRFFLALSLPNSSKMFLSVAIPDNIIPVTLPQNTPTLCTNMGFKLITRQTSNRDIGTGKYQCMICFRTAKGFFFKPCLCCFIYQNSVLYPFCWYYLYLYVQEKQK